VEKKGGIAIPVKIFKSLTVFPFAYARACPLMVREDHKGTNNTGKQTAIVFICTNNEKKQNVFRKN